jgi:predicted RNA binding protein YcfA (HicA-like mRNA interferase family)
MSSKLPVTSAKNLEKILLLMGFEVKRQKGSHVFYRHPDGRYTTIPHHAGRDLGRPLIRQILREIDLTPEDYIQHLQNI